MGHPGFNPGNNRAPWAREDEQAAPSACGVSTAAAVVAAAAVARGRRPVGRLVRRRQVRPSGSAAVGGRPLRPRPGRAAARSSGPPRRRPLRDPRRAAHAAADENAGAVNGYQVIQQIAERSGGAWRPSPGSVYPTIQLLQDEGLVETDDERGPQDPALSPRRARRTSPSTPTSWPPSGRRSSVASATRSPAAASPTSSRRSARSWARCGRSSRPGSETQQRAAVDVLVETRRKLYGILADGQDAAEDDEDGEES